MPILSMISGSSQRLPLCVRKNLDPEAVPLQKKEETLDVLGEVAMDSLSSGLFSRRALEDWLTARGRKQLAPKDLIDSGLLQAVGPQGNQSYFFLHRSIQEYLMARLVAKQSGEELKNFASRSFRVISDVGCKILIHNELYF